MATTFTRDPLTSVSILRNVRTIEIPANTGTITASDMDQDGDPDLLVPEVTLGGTMLSRTLWLDNTDGRGSFSELKPLTDRSSSNA